MDKQIWHYAICLGPAKMLDPDADIISNLAKGEARALDMLMARHLHAIKSLALYMLGDEMMAEDIAQDVFIKAWKHAPRWQSGTAKFSTWLHRVAKNLCYDRLRKKQDIYPDNLPDIVDSAPNAIDNIINQETALTQTQHIRKALTKLPKRQHVAIILCHYQNKSQYDAAQIMEITPHAYESLLARGRQNLRKHLKPHKTKLLSGMGENL